MCGNVQEAPGETQVRHRRWGGWQAQPPCHSNNIYLFIWFASWWTVLSEVTHHLRSAGTALTRWRKPTLKIHQERSLSPCTRLENQKQAKWMHLLSGMLREVGRSCGEVYCAALVTINALKCTDCIKYTCGALRQDQRAPKKWYLLFSDESVKIRGRCYGLNTHHGFAQVWLGWIYPAGFSGEGEPQPQRGFKGEGKTRRGYHL